MSQYCKWDELKDKMLSLQKELCEHKDNMLSLQKELCEHKDELRKFKKHMMYRRVKHAHCSEKLKIATAGFEEENDVVKNHHRMNGLN